MELIDLVDISFEENGSFVLQPLNFTQRKGQRLAVAGESGAGKSTLLQIIAGLVQPSTGEVRIAGRRVRGPAVALVPGHPGVAYLSQKSELPKFLRVEQVLRYASQWPAAEAQALYKLCRIDHLLARPTSQLSGGEQQRVALVRRLLGRPQLLLLDEPFSNLDRGHKRLLQDILEEVSRRLDVTLLLVSHEATDVLAWADEVLVLRRGKLVQQGKPEVVYNQPIDEYTAGLFGDYNLITGVDGEALVPGYQASGVLMLRPEHLALGPAGGRGLAGTVRAVRFFGSFYEIEVALPENVVRIRTAAAQVAVGERVTVTVPRGQAWSFTEQNPALL